VTGGNRKAPAGGSAGPISFGLGRTSIAALLVAPGPGGVVAIIISEHPDADAQITELKRRFPDAHLVRDDQGIEAEMAAVTGFVEAPTSSFRSTSAAPISSSASSGGAGHSLRSDQDLRRYCRGDRLAQGRSRGGQRLLEEPHRVRDPVPPGASPRRLLGGRRRLGRSAPTHHCHPRGRSRAQAGAVCRRRPMSRAAGAEACRAPT
jgi:hypothetical protein